MTAQSPQSQATTTETPNNKEINFRLQEKALKDKYERELSHERSERERLTKELEARNQPEDEDTEQNFLLFMYKYIHKLEILCNFNI